MASEPLADTAPLLSALPLPTEPLSYVYYDKMVTRPLLEWHKGLECHQNSEELGDWVVTKLEHMKSFHFSAVMHEYLRVTVQPGKTHAREPACPPEPPIYLFVERMVETDEVTVGWKKVKYPELVGWWFVRLLRGYFSGAQAGGVQALASSSAIDYWREVGYSASDYLCHLDFEAGIPLLEFSAVLLVSSKSAPQYKAMDTNCFWFASMVYEKLKHTWPCTEEKGTYYKHRGKFAGLHILNRFSKAGRDMRQLQAAAAKPDAREKLEALEKEKAPKVERRESDGSG